MKKLRDIWKRYMLRPMLYRCVTKCAVALAAILLWDRFININEALSPVRDGGFVAAAALLGMAWASYLRLDGLKFHYLLEERRKKKERKKKRHWTKDMVDFVDEHVVSMEELSEDERALCGMLSSLLSALIFLIPALAALLY